MSNCNSEHETDSDSSSSCEENFDFPLPENIILPQFLNSDFKWNYYVSKTKTMQQYCSLIGRITNLNIRKNLKKQIMLLITSDIVVKHRNLSPHWKLLQQHAFFHDENIL